MTTTFTQRRATLADLGWLERLRERAMRAELEALGRWHPQRSRARIEQALRADDVRVIQVGGRSVGSIAWGGGASGWTVSLFYIEAAFAGFGLGSRVLRQGLADHPGTVELDTLIGSRARAFYERNGFRYVRTDGVDERLILRR